MNTTNILLSVLGDWFEHTPSESGSPRDLGGDPIGTNRRITAVIGPRRSGKSTACRLAISHLLERGVPHRNIVYINFEDERLLPAEKGLLSDLPKTHRELVDIDTAFPVYYFLDEIQNVPQWSSWVRRITETDRQTHVVLTGSSSRLLSSEIATELRGRADTVEVFPFSFKEYLLFKKQLPEKVDTLLLTTTGSSKFVRHFMEYLTWGGFPERFEVHDPQALLQGYFRTMFVRDLIERFGIKQTKMFGDYLKIQLQRFASLCSLGALEGDMKAIGYVAAKTTLADYLDHAREGFLLFDVPIFSEKVTEQLRNPRKIFAIDTGLVRSIRFSTQEDYGRYLENFVFLELRRRKADIFYCKGTTECDFLVAEKGHAVQAIQVCWDCSAPETKERELHGLRETMQRYNLSDGLLLTRHENGNAEIDGKHIRILPAWWWALHK